MKPLSPSARSLLDRYRASETLPASSKARLWASVTQSVARGDQPRVELSRTIVGAKRSWLRNAWGQPLWKGMIAAALTLPTLALAAALVTRFTDSEPPPRSAASLAPPVSHARPTSPAAEQVIEPAAIATEHAAPAPQLAKKPIASKAVRSATTRPSPREATIDGEMRLLNQAQAANLAGDSRRALLLLDDYAQRYPSGRLNDVSTVARLIALCNLGQVSLARHEAARFQARYPKSPFKERISRICAPQVLP